MTRVHVVWTDRDGNVGLSWNMLKKLFGTRVHAAHEGNGVFSVHIVHYIEVAHFIIGGGTADKRTETGRYKQLGIFHGDWKKFTEQQAAASTFENTHPM